MPFTSDPAVLRTDFTSERVWKTIKRKMLGEVEDDDAAFTIIDDEAFDGLHGHELRVAVSKQYCHTFVLVADARSINDRGHPILVVDLDSRHARDVELRIAPDQADLVVANLAIANCDIDDFVRAAGPDGVYRGRGRSAAG